MAEYSPHDTPEMALISSAILLRASHNLPQIGIIPRGFNKMLPCSLLGGHRKPHHAVVLACRTVSGQVCQGLMSLTSRAVRKRLGAAFLLVRVLLGCNGPYG